MRLLIILVVVLVLVAGGVFGAATLAPGLLPPAVLAILGIEVPEEEETKVDEQPTDTVLIDMEPMQIPLFRDNDVSRFLILHILIEVRSGPDQKIVDRKLLYLIDAFISYIHKLNALDIEPGLGDREFLKERLMVRAEEIVGAGVIVDLLFVQIFERPIK